MRKQSGRAQPNYSETERDSRKAGTQNDGGQMYKELTITTCEPGSLLYKSCERTDRSTPTPLLAPKEPPT
jgi:hypothetical protein